MAQQRNQGPGHTSRPAVVITEARDRPTVHVTGQGDPAVLTEVSGTVDALVAAGFRDLTVDLTHCVDSTPLLGALARTRAGLLARGATMRLVGVTTPDFLAALTSVPLNDVLAVYDAVHDAEGAAMTTTRRNAGRTLTRSTL
jgi:hypothetical protein